MYRGEESLRGSTNKKLSVVNRVDSEKGTNRECEHQRKCKIYTKIIKDVYKIINNVLNNRNECCSQITTLY